MTKRELASLRRKAKAGDATLRSTEAVGSRPTPEQVVAGRELIARRLRQSGHAELAARFLAADARAREAYDTLQKLRAELRRLTQMNNWSSQRTRDLFRRKNTMQIVHDEAEDEIDRVWSDVKFKLILDDPQDAGRT